jgi:hypothetical protein
MKQGINFMRITRGSVPRMLGIARTRNNAPPAQMPQDGGDIDPDEPSDRLRPYGCNYDESEATGEPPYWATWGF